MATANNVEILINTELDSLITTIESCLYSEKFRSIDAALAWSTTFGLRTNQMDPNYQVCCIEQLRTGWDSCCVSAGSQWFL